MPKYESASRRSGCATIPRHRGRRRPCRARDGLLSATGWRQRHHRRSGPGSGPRDELCKRALCTRAWWSLGTLSGVFWQILKWIGTRRCCRARAIPGLLSWGPKFILNSTRRRHDANTRKNLRLAIFSLQMMQRLREQTPISYQHQSRGVLAVFRTAELQRQALQKCGELGSHGSVIPPLERNALIDLEPALGPIGEHLVAAFTMEPTRGRRSSILRRIGRECSRKAARNCALGLPWMRSTSRKGASITWRAAQRSWSRMPMCWLRAVIHRCSPAKSA